MGRVEHNTPDRKSEIWPDVTIIVVNYNTAYLLDRMFAAIDAARGNLSIQIIVVDNASHDGSVELLRAKYPSVELIQNRTNVGFGRANNQALPKARGCYLLLLNTDAFVAPDTLEKTVGFMNEHRQYGVLGVKLVGADGTVQPSCRYFATPWNVFAASTRVGGWVRRLFFPSARLVDDPNWDPATPAECDWVPGCYYLIRREVVDRVGLFDPRYFLYCEEMDHCHAVRAAGWTVTYYPFTHVIHIGGESAAAAGAIDTQRQIPALHIESELLYFRKHHGIVGVLAAVALSLLADIMKACGAILRRMDTARAATAIHHSATVFDRLVATRLASRPTR